MKSKPSFQSVLVGFCLALGACGPVPDDYFTMRTVGNGVDRPGGVTRVATNASSLSGTWLSDCFTNSSLPGTRFREQLTVIGNSTSRTMSAYSDANCASEIYRMIIPANSSLDSSAHLTEEFGPLSVTATQASGANLLNSSAFCGRSNWQTNMSQGVGDLSYCGMARKRTSTIEIFASNDMYEVRGSLTIHYRKQ